MKKKFFTKKLAAFLGALGIAFSVIPTTAFNEAVIYAATQTPNLNNIKTKDGIIIQMHMWSFNNIKSKLPELAAAGYKAVQVSPIQGCIRGTEWWALYQPTNQAIGNPLGSRDDFKALCSEAEKYGIDIIVDAVMNHMANNGKGREDEWSSQVVDEFKNWDYYHHVGQNSTPDYKDRYRTTQGGIGMPDLNTQHPAIQQKAINFLNDCIASGADGFRFDAVKHIETNVGEDAGKSWAGNYWTNVLGNLNNKNNLFIYGEALDEANSNADNIGGYASFMSVTDHYYGKTLRDAVRNYNLPAAQSWDINTLPTGTRVSYVENHDNYEHNESNITDEQRTFAWGILAARANVTPMYLSRRTGSIGSMGTNDWNNDQVKAVNWFHNAMIGQNEYLRYPNGNTCMQIDRGTKGIAFVNEGSGFNLNNAPTNLASGTYTDKGGSGQSYTVSGGKISGYVPSNRIIVLYDNGGIIIPPTTKAVTCNPETPVVSSQATITYDASNTVLNGASKVNIHWGYDGWKGAKTESMTSLGSNKWSFTLTVPSGATTNLDLVFNNGGSTWDNNNSTDYSITITAKVTPPIPANRVAYFDNSTFNWNNVYVYVYDESGSTVKEVAKWPGVPMNSKGNNLYEYTLTTDWTDARVIFNNGNTSAQIPGSGQKGFALTGIQIYQNNAWANYDPIEIPSTKTIAYFDNSSYNWSNVYIYVYDEKSTSSIQEVAKWPGVPMKNEGNGIYSYEITQDWANKRVIFNNGSNTQVPGSGQEGYPISISNMILQNGIWATK